MVIMPTDLYPSEKHVGVNESYDVTTPVEPITLRFSIPVTVVICILCGVMVIVTVLGNLLVIVAFAVDYGIRRFSNFLILNLAITDFVVGFINVPLYVPYLLTGKWPFGRGLCLFWLVSDYATPAASSWNILMISLDRYWSVSQAIAYKHKQTTRLVLILMIVPWVVGILVYAPAIVFWEMWTGYGHVPKDECYVAFHKHTPYLLFGATVEFIIPFLLVSAANVCIYAHIRRRTRSRTKASKVNKNLLKTETTSIATNSSFSNGCTYDTSISVMNGNSSPSPCRPPLRQNRRLTKDKKTAKAIAIIIVVFGVCWAPYQIMALIRSICSTCSNDVAFEIAFWLLWFNSMINPILYPFTHIKFRQAFQKILCRQKYRRKNARVHVVHAASSGNGS